MARNVLSSICLELPPLLHSLPWLDKAGSGGCFPLNAWGSWDSGRGCKVTDRDHVMWLEELRVCQCWGHAAPGLVSRMQQPLEDLNTVVLVVRASPLPTWLILGGTWRDLHCLGRRHMKNFFLNNLPCSANLLFLWCPLSFFQEYIILFIIFLLKYSWFTILC